MVGARFVVYVNRSVKFNLPNGNSLDILENVFDRMREWIQDDAAKPESCGFLLGYENRNTHNITLTDITVPQSGDYRSRFLCKISDALHFRFLKSSKKQGNFYMGAWHTHPQKVPNPSPIDLNDWAEILRKDKTGSDYAFFIILGETEFRIWAGDFSTLSIVEIYEADIQNGVYLRG